MAKRMKKAGSRSSLGDPMTFSTRLTPEQRRVIEEAASILKWPPATFVRDAAVRRAAEIVEVDENVRRRLAQIADVIIRQFEGKGGFRARRGTPEGEEVTEINKEEIEVPAVPYLYEFGDGDETALLAPSPLDSQISRELKSVLRACAIEFARLLLERWELSGTEPGAFVPKLNIENLLTGRDEEE